jgi:hypothetical protein
MGSGGGSVGVAGIAKHAKVVVGGGCAIQCEVGSGMVHRLRGKAVEKMCSSVQGLCLVASRRLKEKATNHVGDGANDAFYPIVLGRGVRARETQLNDVGEEEGARGVVVEPATVITLKGTNRATELGGDPNEEVSEGGECVGLQSKGRSPKKVRKTIQNHQVVFVSRKTEYRGSLEITMN